jgi:hypothetical protein
MSSRPLPSRKLQPQIKLSELEPNLPIRSLPPRPNLDQLKLQAKELRQMHGKKSRAAAARLVTHLPRLKGATIEKSLDESLSVADAQLVIAREYGRANWAQLKHFVELAGRIAEFKPHPRFDETVAALDYGDLKKLRSLLKSDPGLVSARTNFGPPYGYFTGATLLHHLAGNPDRGRFEGKLPPLPKNTPELARALLDAGADVNAETLPPSGGTNLMGLIITSQLASNAGITGPLMDVLLKYGAKLDLKSPDALYTPLIDHAPRAAEKMIELGAKPDVCVAAGLGRMDLLRDCFDDHGALKHRPRRGGKSLSERDAIGLAMLFAYVNTQPAAVDFLLEKNGNWNMIGVNNGTALHRATSGGDLPMVQRLVAKGADLSNRNNPFNATPFSWADHFHKSNVVQWMRTHCKLDLHDAVSFNLDDQARARIRENPEGVHVRIDQWEIPRATPLHCAALQSGSTFSKEHDHLAGLLLDHGADPNALAGNGSTPLDIATERGTDGVIKMLKARGGKHSAEL